MKKHANEAEALTCDACGFQRFIEAIRQSWDAETSVDPGWSVDNAPLGQCAVTALVVQDKLGGDLMRTTVGGVSHYYNRLPNGVDLDLTRDQFPAWEPTEPEVRDRDYAMSFLATARRYELLRSRVARLLGDAA